ncbi:MAG: 23S rRNA (uracil(1939)-C(5))-methyltransferase RlmD [Oscillospiraceae bacterium]
MEEKNCPVYKKCSGCQLRNMSYEETLRFKEIKVVRLMGKLCRVNPVIGMDDPYHYRSKVQAGFRYRGGHIESGVFQSSTGGIVPVNDCLSDDVTANKIIVSVRKLAEQLKIPVYNERSGRGFLRHVLIRRGFATGEVMVVIVAANHNFPSKSVFVKELTKLYPEIVSVVLNINTDPYKMLLSRDETVLFGRGYIEEIICGERFRISPKSFCQVNPVQTEVLYNKAIELAGLKGDETVLDAYCGIGTISIIAARHAKQVYGVEINRSAVNDAIVNAEVNKAENVKFVCADAGKYLAEMKERHVHCDAAFLDPARAGCDRRVLSALANLAPDKIVYISCNPETQARDVFFLIQNGYMLRAIQPVDMFPFTQHVETVCLLSKLKSDRHAEVR